MIDFLLGAVAFAAGSFLVKKVYDYFNPPKTPYRSPETDHYANPVRPERTFPSIRIANQEIEELRKKAKRDRCLHEKDRIRIEELEREIDVLYKNYETSKHRETLEKVEKNPGEFGEYQITSEKLNIIQYHVGETVIGKKCYGCHKPMILQFRRDKVIISLDDFFWACSGYYSDECKATQKFSISDTILFTQKNKPELDLTTEGLGRIFSNPKIQIDIAKRVRKHCGEQLEEYVCPIHKEPLRLRQKNLYNGVIDQFFLGCPRWNPVDGCSYVQKLKSPAQLASYLQKSEGRGML
jgi:hypothetical protein